MELLLIWFILSSLLVALFIVWVAQVSLALHNGVLLTGSSVQLFR